MAGNQEMLAWLRKRQTGIGGSDAPVLVLKKVFDKTPLDIYISKKKEITAADLLEESDDIRRGHEYEPRAVAKFTETTGIKVHAPQTDADRISDEFFVRDPDAHHRYINFDGFCEDGWVAEIKSPRQRAVDRMKNEGINDYYQIQAQIQAGLANKVGCKFWGPGECKGTRIIIYEPENVKIMVVELPIDQPWIDQINDVIDRFWREHIEKNRPPITWAPPEMQSKKRVGGKYKSVEGEAWVEACEAFTFAKDMADSAKKRYENAKALIAEAMDAVQLDKIVLPNGTKFSYTEQTRKSFDVKALQAAHPDMDLTPFYREGEPFKVLRSYNVADAIDSDESLERQLQGIQEELESMAGRNLDPELMVEMFDELQNRADLYISTLSSEVDQIASALEKTRDAVARRITKGKVNG